MAWTIASNDLVNIYHVRFSTKQGFVLCWCNRIKQESRPKLPTGEQFLMQASYLASSSAHFYVLMVKHSGQNIRLQ